MVEGSSVEVPAVKGSEPRIEDFLSNAVVALKVQDPAEDEGADAEDDGAEAEAADPAVDGKKKKKRKKAPKKKLVKAPICRVLGGSTDYFIKYGQTDPPTKPVQSLFPSGRFPEGEMQPHGKTKYPDPQSSWMRQSEEEKRATERLQSTNYEQLRLAAEVHRQVRAHAHSQIRPGMLLVDLVDLVESTNRKLVQERGLQCGIGFPTGCSLNHIAAHFTPNAADRTVLGVDDVLKVDFGTQVGGHIIDCAWTVAFNEQFDPLLHAVKSATNAGIRAAGIDMQMDEIGAVIQEVMESHEVTINGHTYPVKCCRTLFGHNIGPYHIHHGKSVPVLPNGDRTRMEEGELYAIETFGTTGNGWIVEDESMECSHYMKSYDAPHVPLRSPSAKKLLTHINRTFGTLAFCRRWLERDDGGSFAVNGITGKQENYMPGLRALCDAGIVDACPPLVDIKDSYVAQFEHTFLLRPTCKEVLSRGEDF